MRRQLTGLDQYQKQFMDAFKSLTYSRNNWEVWSDFVTIAACSLSNSVDCSPKHDDREKLYLSTVKRYKEEELDYFAQMLATTVEAFEENAEQDFLGELFQALELSNHWTGQFFTPYVVCKMMAKMQFSANDKAKITEKGYISVNDPACGAGALLIAFANECRKLEINYQTSVEFVAQDIDHTAAMMCYIQLSLLGCPGYVIVGDTLRHPPTVPLPPDYEVWYTPFYFSEVWHWRRIFNSMSQILKTNESGTNVTKTLSEPPKVLSKPLKTYMSGFYFYYYYYDEASG
jgi:hypothetical protein